MQRTNFWDYGIPTEASALECRLSDALSSLLSRNVGSNQSVGRAGHKAGENYRRREYLLFQIFENALKLKAKSVLTDGIY